MKWRRLEFKDFVTLQRGFDLPQAHMHAGDFPVLGSNCIIGFHNEAKVQPPGVVTGRSGTLGKVQFTDQPYWPHNTALWVKDFKGNEPKYVYYKLETLNLDQFSSGASVPTLNRNNLDNLLVDVPLPQVQRDIAEVLSGYDDLIENNRRRITLLEESARLLYQEWFVRLRFPGCEHVQVVDGVPAGWKNVTTSVAVDINPSTKLSEADEQWSVEMADIAPNSMVIQNTAKRHIRSGSKFKNGDTLFARITPCLENGKTAFVNFLEENETARGSTEFIVLRSKLLTPEFVYCLARNYDFRENAIKSMIGSSGRQRVQESCFEKFFVMVPPHCILDNFTDTVRPIFQQIKILHSQTNKLRAARDILLPKLMNGEIAV